NLQIDAHFRLFMTRMSPPDRAGPPPSDRISSGPVIKSSREAIVRLVQCSPLSSSCRFVSRWIRSAQDAPPADKRAGPLLPQKQVLWLPQAVLRSQEDARCAPAVPESVSPVRQAR